MPLKPDVADETRDQFIKNLDESDRYIPGLVDSSAAMDLHTPTAVWEMTFEEEEAYAGPYMVHPYHIATLDNYLLGDSPQLITHDIGASRYRLTDPGQRLTEGVRRVVLMNLTEDADIAPLEALVSRGEGVATSTYGADDIGWQSSKGRQWSHVWEQGFTDMTALNDYLRTPHGITTSSREGFRRVGVELQSLRILTYPFTLKPAQSPPEMPKQAPVLYSITARTALEDADTYIHLLETEYDPALADVGGSLLHRYRTIDQGYSEAEVQSTWQLDSLEAFKDFRAGSSTHPSWNRFVVNAMPLVKSGTRRFYRSV